MKFMERWLGVAAEICLLLSRLAGMEDRNMQPAADQADQEARAVLALYLSRGEEEAYSFMLANARMMVIQGRKDLDLTVLDLVEHFLSMPHGPHCPPVRKVAVMLRRLAHKLNREYGSPDRDGRFLRLVPECERSATGS